MINYVDFNGEQTPILFGNAAFYQYEKRYNESGFKGFANAVPPANENGEIDYTGVKISFFVDITFCAFLAAGNVERKAFKASVDEVAMWLTAENLMKVMEFIVDSLPRETKDDTADTESEVSGE